MSVLAPSVAILWRIIESYELDPAPFFQEEGIEINWPIEPGTRLSYHALDRVRARAAERSGDPGFGLRAAEFVHPSQLGALGYAFLASSTLRNAFQCMHRYIRILNDQGQFDVVEENGEAIVRLLVTQSSENLRVREDGQMSYLLQLCRLNCGPHFAPKRVGFRHPEPKDLRPYERLFGCPVEFNRAHNELVVSSEQLDEPLPTANPILAQMNERIAMRRLAKLDQDDIINRVRVVLMEQLPTGKVSDESVAEALHMTSRTLHRRMKQEDESFRSMLKAVRQELAAQYINDNTLTLTEITFLLGFSEMSSFSRAYKHWNGMSPSEARSTS